jgi:transposase
MTPAEDAPRTAPSDEAATPAALVEENARLRAENAALQETIAVLLARVAELERRLGLNSSNSGKPPSSDGLHKPRREPRTRSLRERSGKPPGGQKGHKGETLRQVDAPSHTVEHYPEACPACGSALSGAMSTGYGARQVFDLPEPRPLIVTEHRAHTCRCGHAYVNELRPTLLTNVGSPWLQWLLITDAARPSQPARPLGAVQKAARRPCLVANTLIMGQRLAWPGCV